MGRLTADPFESFVNSEESKTEIAQDYLKLLFESFVNSEESKTPCIFSVVRLPFESFVNSEESKTIARSGGSGSCLRALLIQKKVKR